MRWQVVPDNEETILATMNLGVSGCRGAVPAVCWVSGFGIGMPDGPWGGVFFLRRFEIIFQKDGSCSKICIPWHHIWIFSVPYYIVPMIFGKIYILNQMPKANKRQYYLETYMPWHQCFSFFFAFDCPMVMRDWETLQLSVHRLSRKTWSASKLCDVVTWRPPIGGSRWSWDVFLKCLHSHWRGFRCWLVGCQKYFLVGKKHEIIWVDRCIASYSWRISLDKWEDYREFTEV